MVSVATASTSDRKVTGTGPSLRMSAQTPSRSPAWYRLANDATVPTPSVSTVRVHCAQYADVPGMVATAPMLLWKSSAQVVASDPAQVGEVRARLSAGGLDAPGHEEDRVPRSL